MLTCAGSEIPLIDPLPGSSVREFCGVAERAALEKILHGAPVRLDPAARVAIEAVRRHADLREAKLRAAIDCAELKGCDRIMIVHQSLARQAWTIFCPG
jgi:hypothetical protein